jgi:transcriptional regulator of acetoin/glycerol metabolism
LVERACALADSPRIRRRDLPDSVLRGESARRAAAPGGGQLATLAASGLDLPLQEAREQWLSALEGAYLKEQLARHGGNISAAAKAANIDRKTFHRLVTKHQIR